MTDYASQIVRLLQYKHWTVATVESCTAGGVRNALAIRQHASNERKERVVNTKSNYGVQKTGIVDCNEHNSQDAIKMAKEIKKAANSNFGIGVAGQLGKVDPANPVDKLNHVWYAIVLPNNIVIDYHMVLSIYDNSLELQKKCVIYHVLKSLCSILVGPMIELARLNRELSIQQAASQLSISQQRWEAYELGERYPSLSELKLIFKSLGTINQYIIDSDYETLSSKMQPSSINSTYDLLQNRMNLM